jgi:hypothetical protein
MNKYKIIPSNLSYKSAPIVDQELNINLEAQSQELVEYDRSATISLAQVYDDERQASYTFRPTFKVNYLYENGITGATDYLPFQYNLYYVDPIESKISGVWKGFPQYYEFDFFRTKTSDQHLDYKSASAYSYNWNYYITYPSNNDENKNMSYSSSAIGNINWVAKDGIPFSLLNSSLNGKPTIEFQCIAPHGLSVGEYVELSFSYSNTNIFQVYSLGNGMFDSESNIFSILNYGYTGTTFNNGRTGTFKRVINPSNLTETRSKYYVRKHKVLTNVGDVTAIKNGFELNPFKDEKKYEFAPITPNGVSRVSQKTSSNSYNFTIEKDINLFGLLDNQNRPVSELFLTIINRGYTGYFNYPTANVGLKQGWAFNITNSPNSWWDATNVNSNTNIGVNSYVKTNGVTKTFYYNKDLQKGDLIDGDFCEWNDYEQAERVVSNYYQKIKFNENVFQTTQTPNTNSPGYYYIPHNKLTIRVFSDYIETGNPENVLNIPNYAYYSQSDASFRWRDLYTYGFIDNLGRGVDYPYLNNAHYPFSNVVFRLIPEGYNQSYNLGMDITIKPLIDGCE